MSVYGDGGPAFPLPLEEGEIRRDGSGADGLSRRDYFAAAAVAGVINVTMFPWDPEVIAGRAFAIADAMLEASQEFPNSEGG